MEEHKCPRKEANLSWKVNLNQQQLPPQEHRNLCSAFPAASCCPKCLSCMTPSWHLPWCQGQSLLPVPAGTQPLCHGTDHTLLPLHKPCSRLPLLSAARGRRAAQIQCNERVFRLIIDAAAVRGRWQSAEQNAGRHQISTQVQIHLVSYSQLPFFFSFLSHSVFFWVIITDLQHTFSAVHHCFQMKVGSQRPVMSLVIKFALMHLLFNVCRTVQMKGEGEDLL